MSRLWLLLSVLMLSIFSGIPGSISSAEASPPFCCWKLLKEDVASQLCIYDCPQEGYPDCQFSITATTRQFTLFSSRELLSQAVRSLSTVYHPIRRDQSDWPIVDGAAEEHAPPGSFILVLNQEALGIQFTVGEPGMVSKSYKQKLEKQLTGVPSLNTELATFAVVQRIKDLDS